MQRVQAQSCRFKALVRIGVIAIALIAAITCMVQKDGWHIDEIATLGLANGSQDGYITAYDDAKYGRGAFLRDVILGNSLEEAVRNVGKILSEFAENGLPGFSIRDQYIAYTRESTPIWKDGDDFREYLLADGFSIRDVYINQILDNHPPLYYLFVRAAYAIYDAAGGEEITLWPAFWVNALFLCGCCLLLMRIGEKRFHSFALGVGAALFFALCPAGLSLAVYMRMYMALCFFVLLSLDAHLALWQNGWVYTRRLGWYTAVTCALGFLTHYYFAIWALCTGAVCFALMLAAKCPRRVWGYIGRMAGGVGMSLVLWPFSIVHLLFSNRGAQAVASLDGGALNGVFSGANTFLKYIYGTAALPLLLIIGLVVLFLILRHRSALAEGKDARASWLICSVPALLYLGVVFVISPYEDLRYMACAVPLFALMTAFCLWQFAGMCRSKLLRAGLCGLLCAVIALGALVIQEPMYLYPNTDDAKQFLAASEGKTCVYLTSTGAAFFREMPDLTHYGKVLIVNKQELRLLAEDERIANADEIILYIHDSYSQTDAMHAVLELTHFTNYEVLVQSHPGLDARVYLLFVEKEQTSPSDTAAIHSNL